MEKYITGQKVFDEYGLDYQQLAKAVLDGKIKCYNDDHDEIVDASSIEEKENLCSYGNTLFFSISIPNMFFIYPDFLEKSEIIKIESCAKILPNAAKKIVDSSTNSEEYIGQLAKVSFVYEKTNVLVTKNGQIRLENDNKLFSLSHGKKIRYNGIFFSFSNNLNKNKQNETVVQIEIPDPTQISKPISFNFIVYSYTNEDINKILFHLNAINEICNKIKSNNCRSFYLSNNSDSEESQQLLFSTFKDHMDNFYNDCKLLPIYLQNYFYELFNEFDSYYKKINIRSNAFHLYSVINLYEKIFNININKILLNNIDYNINEILNFERSSSMREKIINDNIKECKLTYIITKKDKNKIYILLNGNIISHNGKINDVISISDKKNDKYNKIYDTFYKCFENNKEQLINTNKSKELIESFQYAENYQIINRHFYPDKEFKKDYYYFNISEFLLFYPHEVEVEQSIFKNDVLSFLFNEAEIIEFNKELKKIKHYTIKLEYYSNTLKDEIKEFYKFCNEIFSDSNSKEKYNSFFKLIGSEKDINIFLIVFYIYYNEFEHIGKKEKKEHNKKVYSELHKLNLVDESKSDGAIETYLSRNRIESALETYEQDKEKENLSKEIKKKYSLIEKYESIFPFIAYNTLNGTSNTEDSEINRKIITKIQSSKNGLDKLNVTLG